MVIAKFGLKWTTSKLISMGYKQLAKSGQGSKSKKEIKQTIEITKLLCDSLDVRTMRKIIFEIREGSGDVTPILDKLFDDVQRAIVKNKRGELGRMDPESLKKMWRDGKKQLKEQIASRVRGVATNAVIKVFRLKKKRREAIRHWIIQRHRPG
jgi:hypothetical protein